MILLFTILFNALEAISEGLYDRGSKLLSGIIEFVKTALIVLICVLWFKGIVYYTTDKDFWSLIISFVLVRYFMFDWVYNIFRGVNSMFFIGNTKLFDKLLRKLPPMIVIITKCIAGFLGIIFLL